MLKIKEGDTKMTIISTLIKEMIAFEGNNPHKINHFLKVYGFAKTIGEIEGIDKEKQDILEITSILHDIGIKISLEKYNTSAGPYQEKEGAIKARELMELHGIDEKIIDRVCYLIGHHHTYTNIDGMDYQILVEADFLVNLYEKNMDKESIISVRDNIFKTKAGIEILETMFNID